MVIAADMAGNRAGNGAGAEAATAPPRRPAGGIPEFNLFGESGAFPDTVHCERMGDRARLHDWVIPPHRHAEVAQLFLMRRGHARISLDTRDLSLTDGRFLYVPAQVVHAVTLDPGSDGLALSFPLSVVAGVQPRLRELAGPVWADAGEDLAALTDQFARAFHSIGSYRADLLIALSHAILATVSRIGAPGGGAGVAPRAHRQMQRFQALLAQHLTDGWRPRDYASALSITTGHLNRICREATGISLSQHIDTALMGEAVRLLTYTQLPVAEIGYRLGFFDPPHFSRRFRALRGETPSACRARSAPPAG